MGGGGCMPNISKESLIYMESIQKLLVPEIDFLSERKVHKGKIIGKFLHSRSFLKWERQD